MNEFNARELRKLILEMAYSGKTVHIACAFSIVELLAVIYAKHLRFDRRDPRSALRDYLVLSKGHGVMAQYACMRQLGWLSDDDLSNYFGDGTILKGLADAHVPGVEASGGSLGHGLSVAVGLALGAKLSGTDQMVYAVVGDGELNEGAIWEALLFANQFRLDNLVVLVDENGFQAMGSTDDVMSLGDIREKFSAFGLEALSIDGHDEPTIDTALARLRSQRNGRPKALVARTVKGKGVSFMENDNRWHYTRLTPELFASAMAELGYQP
jgi:transketolase